jgi:hypothetical protein
MSACAGSSTDGLAASPLVSPGTVRPARARFFRYFAGQVQMDRAPGRIGFMSTQRREIRWRHIRCAGRWGQTFLCPLAQRASAIASGGTAPPGFPAWFATNSLQSGFRIVQLDRLVQLLFVQLVQLVQLVLLVRLVLRHGSPPFGAVLARQPEDQRITVSPSRTSPSLPASRVFHPTLPWVPAGRRRWAERYDGKGNLYLQHAA